MSLWSRAGQSITPPSSHFFSQHDGLKSPEWGLFFGRGDCVGGLATILLRLDPPRVVGSGSESDNEDGALDDGEFEEELAAEVGGRRHQTSADAKVVADCQ